jgi:BolA protein
MGAVADTIAAKLNTVFSPSRLEVVDDSHRHQGHAGHREGGESHFNLLIEAEAFAGKGRVARQRLIFAALAEEMAGPVHALSITAKAPGEA